MSDHEHEIRVDMYRRPIDNWIVLHVFCNKRDCDWQMTSPEFERLLEREKALREKFGEYAWQNEVIQPEMLMTELESLPGVSAEQFKEEWLYTFFSSLNEEET